jgi:hypothetical protein
MFLQAERLVEHGSLCRDAGYIQGMELEGEPDHE